MFLETGIQAIKTFVLIRNVVVQNAAKPFLEIYTYKEFYCLFYLAIENINKNYQLRKTNFSVIVRIPFILINTPTQYINCLHNQHSVRQLLFFAYQALVADISSLSGWLVNAMSSTSLLNAFIIRKRDVEG